LIIHYCCHGYVADTCAVHTQPSLHVNCGLAEKLLLEAEHSSQRLVDLVGMRHHHMNLDDEPETLNKQQYTSAIWSVCLLSVQHIAKVHGGSYPKGTTELPTLMLRTIALSLEKVWFKHCQEGV
jgi:hypothetical protein